MTNKWGPYMTEHLDPMRIANEKIEELMRMVAYERGQRTFLAAQVEQLTNALREAQMKLTEERGDRDASNDRSIGEIRSAIRRADWVCVCISDDDRSDCAEPCPLRVYTFGEIPTPPEVQDMVRDAINGTGDFADE